MSNIQKVLIMFMMSSVVLVHADDEPTVDVDSSEYAAVEHERKFGQKPDSDTNTIASQTTAVINMLSSSGTTTRDYAAVYQESNVLVNNDTGVAFDTNGPLNGITHTASSTDVTIATTGVYLAEYTVAFNGTINQNSSGGFPANVLFPITAGTAVDFQLNVNGVDVANTLVRGQGFGVTSMVWSGMLSLSAGDVVQLRNKSGVAVTLPSPGGYTSASLTLLQVA